jgi:hypothetical protein
MVKKVPDIPYTFAFPASMNFETEEPTEVCFRFLLDKDLLAAFQCGVFQNFT